MDGNSCCSASGLRRSGQRFRHCWERIGLVLVILTVQASTAHPQERRWWLSLSAKSMLGWEVHRIIEHARLTNSDDELFGPSEMERRVSSTGFAIGPELTIGWRRWRARGAYAISNHMLSGDGSSDNYYISADVGYGTWISGFVGVRSLRVGYDDLDSSGLNEYDLTVPVVGAQCHLQKCRSPWMLDFNACAGSGGLGAIFNYVESLEQPELVEVELTVGFRPSDRRYQFDFGYYFWSHADPAGSYVPSSTLIFDRIWLQYFPIWHGFVLRSRYWFGEK